MILTIQIIEYLGIVCTKDPHSISAICFGDSGGPLIRLACNKKWLN